MERVVLGLGSNKKLNSLTSIELLQNACQELSSFIKDIEFSSMYKTAAMYFENQDDFYNMVAVGKFEGTAEDLLGKIHAIEQKFGRDRSKEFRNGPRSLDIDIELFGTQNIKTNDLVVPHERLCERAFVIIPFLEVLKRNADVNRVEIDFYSQKVELLKNQRIEKIPL